jgi:hypothetical protein
MRIKRTIQIIQNANSILIIGLIVAGLSLFAKSQNGKLIAIEMPVAIIFVLTFFFRKLIVNYYLKKSKYPGVFYSVLDKLGMTHHLEIGLTDDLLNEIYQPTYSTNEFLNDNNINPIIGRKKISTWIVIFTIGSGIVGLIYLSKKIKFRDQPFVFIGLAVFIVIAFYAWRKLKRQRDDDSAYARFTEKGLYINDDMIDWKSIYDWSYEPGHENDTGKIVINYYDKDKNIQEIDASLSSMNTDRIDFLLLLTHYKGKYGQISQESVESLVN